MCNPCLYVSRKSSNKFTLVFYLFASFRLVFDYTCALLLISLFEFYFSKLTSDVSRLLLLFSLELWMVALFMKQIMKELETIMPVLGITKYFLGLTAEVDERNLLQREDNDVDSNLVIADDIFNSMGVSSDSSSPASERERWDKMLFLDSCIQQI